jgi:hypothetical protein
MLNDEIVLPNYKLQTFKVLEMCFLNLQGCKTHFDLLNCKEIKTQAFNSFMIRYFKLI